MDDDDDATPQIDALAAPPSAPSPAQAQPWPLSSKRKRRGGDDAAADDDDAQDDKGWDKPRASTAKKPENRSSKHAPVEMISSARSHADATS